MALSQVDVHNPPPWGEPLAGQLELLTVDSELLLGNALGDPARRSLYVYAAPGAEAGVPAVYVLNGHGSTVSSWLAPGGFDPSKLARIDAMFGSGECPPAVIVFVDAWTKLGGSQFVNSTAIGRYADYLCDEIVPFIDSAYPVIAAASGRGITGHSSGGYGALVNAMRRPDLFGAIAAHAPDALFELTCVSDFAAVVRALREDFEGSPQRFFSELQRADPFDWDRFGTVLVTYLNAAAYSPDPAVPTQPQFPFDLRTGRVIGSVMERWLAVDPVNMIAAHADALGGMRRIHLEAGRRDEYYLDIGATAVSAELTALGIAHSFELFNGGHGGISYRYPAAIRELVLALGAP